MENRPPVATALGRALRRRCPECGFGPLFDRWFTPHDVCGGCGLLPDRGESDYFLGALLVNFMVTELAIAGTLLVALAATLPDPPWTGLAVAGLAAAVIIPVVVYPIARMVWLAVDLRFRAPIRDGEARPAFDVS